MKTLFKENEEGVRLIDYLAVAFVLLIIGLAGGLE